MGFELFPPEINSGLMYTGPGPGSMLSAAAAWDSLAADLYASAQSYQSVVSGLTGTWRGPTSLTMATAVAPYMGWMNSTASLAEQAGAQVKAAAAAYEAAYAATVPPAVIAANRALLALLVATNFFGQNYPAIAATEAQYMEMWAQDGLVMNTYAAVSGQLTSSLAPFDAPATTANPVTAAEEAIMSAASSVESTVLSTLSGVTTTLSATLSGLTAASPLSGLSGLVSGSGLSGIIASTPLAGILGGGGLSASTLSLAINFVIVPSYLVSYLGLTGVRMLVSMASSMGTSGAGLNMNTLARNINDMINAKLQPAVRGLAGQFVSMNRAVLANLGRANSIGGLSVPKGWSQPKPQVLTRAAPVLPETSVASPAINEGTPTMSNPFTQALMSTLAGRGVGGQQNTKGGIKGVTRVPAGG